MWVLAFAVIAVAMVPDAVARAQLFTNGRCPALQAGETVQTDIDDALQRVVDSAVMTENDILAAMRMRCGALRATEVVAAADVGDQDENVNALRALRATRKLAHGALLQHAGSKSLMDVVTLLDRVTVAFVLRHYGAHVDADIANDIGGQACAGASSPTDIAADADLSTLIAETGAITYVQACDTSAEYVGLQLGRIEARTHARIEAGELTQVEVQLSSQLLSEIIAKVETVFVPDPKAPFSEPRMALHDSSLAKLLATYLDVCPSGGVQGLKGQQRAAFELLADGGLRAHRRDEMSFSIADGPRWQVARVTLVGERGAVVVACQVLPSSDDGWVFQPPATSNLSPGDIALLELFGPRSEGDLSREAAAASVRTKSLADAVILHDAETNESVNVLVVNALQRGDATDAQQWLSRARTRGNDLKGAFPLARNVSLNNVFLAHVQALDQRLAAIEQQLTANPWTAEHLASLLSKPTAVANAEEILRWYLETPAQFRASLRQRHRFPVVVDGSASMSRLVVTYGSGAENDREDRAGERVGVVVSRVPRGTTPTFFSQTIVVPRPDPATTILPVLRAAFTGTLALAAPPPPSSPARMDSALTPAVSYETYAFVTTIVEGGTEQRVRVCSTATCTATTEDANVANRVVLEGDRRFGVVGLASLAVGFHLGDERLRLRRVGNGMPDQIYRVEADDDRTAVFGAVGLGLRFRCFILSANVVSIGRNIEKFRAWNFGIGFRLRSVSESMYLQLFAGWSKPRVFRDVNEGDLIVSPSATPPDLETRRQWIPTVGLALSFDLASLASGASDLLKTVGGQ